MSFVQNTKHKERTQRYANTGNTQSEARRKRSMQRSGWTKKKQKRKQNREEQKADTAARENDSNDLCAKHIAQGACAPLR